MSTQSILDEVGTFTWDFGQNFFIETSKGNFLWSDPDYGGDNTLKSYSGSYEEYIGEGYGRAKGKHVIRAYCGPDVKINS